MFCYLPFYVIQTGRNNVIVVVGDVEDSSNERKAFILREQPKLGEYASDVFLFNEFKDDKAPFEGPKIEDLKNTIKKRGKKQICWLCRLIFI